MINTRLLKAKMVECGYTQKQMAAKLRIDPKTFGNHLNNGVFDSNEIYEMIRTLGITNVTEIFFTDVCS